MDSRTRSYLAYWNAQKGGALVFQGRRQNGDGLGDVLRGWLTRFGPAIGNVVRNVASGFMSSAAQGINEGKSVKEVLKGTIKPTLAAGLASGADLLKQSGTGRRKRRAPPRSVQVKRRRATPGSARNSTKRRSAQRGGKRARRGKPIAAPRRVYKRGRRTVPIKRQSRKLNFISNF